MGKKWEIIKKLSDKQFPKKDREQSTVSIEDVVQQLLKNRALAGKKDIEAFLNPKDPYEFTAKEVGVDPKQLTRAIVRISKAIDAKESIVVYADYDADGITAGAILWETLYQLGARAMPYIPHRVEEGYGLSIKGIEAVRQQYDPSLIITVDHGITAHEKVTYAKKLGIDVIVTDHHVKPEKLPDCTTVHTTQLCGAGVSWFVAKELLKKYHVSSSKHQDELIALAAIGTIADMVPLVGPNRSIAKYGLVAINTTTREGLAAITSDAGLTLGALGTYDISHIVAPRLNAMGRLEHAMDALRLLCTKQKDKAQILAARLGLTNKERQQLTVDTVLHARDGLPKTLKKLLFVSHESYNQGVIGLVAGKLVEEFYRPAVVVALGDKVSKASARSITGFNIVAALRRCSDLLVDVGGHPMAAGFTVETKNLPALQKRLETLAEEELDEAKLTRTLKIDVEMPLTAANEALWKALRDFEPFGFGNPEPVFVSRGVVIADVRLVGAAGKHLKLRLHVSNHITMKQSNNLIVDAIAFNFGSLYGKLQSQAMIDVAYAIDMNVWNNSRTLQLKVKDIAFSG